MGCLMASRHTVKHIVTIPLTEIDFQFARAGGPGGQNVNKVETKVVLLFDYTSSNVLSWEQKGRLGAHPAVQSKLNADGVIAVTSQEHRTQALNREAAVEKLHELLDAALKRVRKRLPTKPTRASQRKRLEGKKAHSAVKAGRKRVGREE